MLLYWFACPLSRIPSAECCIPRLLTRKHWTIFSDNLKNLLYYRSYSYLCHISKRAFFRSHFGTSRPLLTLTAPLTILSPASPSPMVATLARHFADWSVRTIFTEQTMAESICKSSPSLSALAFPFPRFTGHVWTRCLCAFRFRPIDWGVIGEVVGCKDALFGSLLRQELQEGLRCGLTISL